MGNYGFTGEKYTRMKDRIGIKYLSKNYGEYTIVEVLPDYKCKVRFENTGNIVLTNNTIAQKGVVCDTSVENLVYGWGINDVDYPVTKRGRTDDQDKIICVCPYYRDWREIIKRCYDLKFKQKHISYMDCAICEEWRYLSKFIEWVDSQPNKDWENCQPDKDILVVGNKHYGPDTVVYVSQKLNCFVTTSNKTRGNYFIGVEYLPMISKEKPYKSCCSNPFIGKQEYLGMSTTELEAHLAWQAKKHEHALRLAEEQNDPRVAKALRERYAPDKDWTDV